MDIQKLIDGEYSHAERAKLLASIGDSAQDWRALALASLEELQFSREVSLAALDVKPSNSEQTTAPMQFLKQDGLNSLEAGNGTVRLASAYFPNRITMNWFSAIAACTLFLIGLYGGAWMHSQQSPNGNSLEGSIANNGSKTSPTPGTENMPGLQGNQGLLDQSKTPYVYANNEIPLVDAHGIDPSLLVANEAYEAARLKQQLRKLGFDAEVQPQFYTGRLKDGRQVVLPVHNVSLRPTGL